MFCSGLNKNVRKIMQDYTPEVEEKLDVAIRFSTGVKNALQSGTALALVAVLPGDKDEELRQKAIHAANFAIDKLNIIKTCVGKDGLDEKIQCVLDELKNYTSESTHAYILKLASLMTAFLDDMAQREHFYDTITQMSVVASKKEVD